MKRILHLPVLAVVLTGCSSLWNAANRDSLRSDVLEILETADAAPAGMVCQMVGNTRTGFCLFDASSQDAAALTSELGLEESIARLASQEASSWILTDIQAGCLSAFAAGSIDGVDGYWISGRPEHLSLSSGGQFEYMALLLNPSLSVVCIQVSYAYG